MWTKHSRFAQATGITMTKAVLPELNASPELPNFRGADRNARLLEQGRLQQNVAFQSIRIPRQDIDLIHQHLSFTSNHSSLTGKQQQMFELDCTKLVMGAKLPQEVTIEGVVSVVDKWEVRLKIPNLSMTSTFDGSVKTGTLLKKYWELVDSLPNLTAEQQPRLVAIGKWEGKQPE